MAAHLKEAHAELLRTFQSNSSDTTSVRSQLTKLKIALTEAGLLVPSFSVTTSAGGTSDGASRAQLPADVESLVMARDVLEVGALFSIRVKDINSFDRYMNLLKAFYNDFSSQLPPSTNHEPLLGLSLLRLLSSNAIASFHTALEALPSDLVQKSPYLQHPVNLERWLMEGSYSKVWRAQKEAPREEYKFFVDSLMGTIRHEIASCEEKAYDSLPLRDAAMLLFFDNAQDVMNFANERGWIINPTTQTVHFPNAAPDYSKTEIPKKSIIALNLQFAKELESIV
ncbi:proteasome 26S subunit [Tilletiaria anomala UBC 951]|uniref:Proteasome 26S subunit n=1 Tax=Tilletiaria anomala (strain ATCC 24038 / CBS 436.72 / UBC 951) TaxID=1037660 RepID=A0A066VAL2_TILAU|nr:proteasome 26S subunit [Tilletiaria anomala UBC 951]KDN38506.1 proteasome 26S subunit [Tilletiaria anomala UBC 951]